MTAVVRTGLSSSSRPLPRVSFVGSLIEGPCSTAARGVLAVCPSLPPTSSPRVSCVAGADCVASRGGPSATSPAAGSSLSACAGSPARPGAADSASTRLVAALDLAVGMVIVPRYGRPEVVEAVTVDGARAARDEATTVVLVTDRARRRGAGDELFRVLR